MSKSKKGGRDKMKNKKDIPIGQPESMDTVNSKKIEVQLIHFRENLDQDHVDNLNLHKSIYRDIINTYSIKNRDYGGSFSKIYQEFGITSTAIRLSDKVNRLVTLSKQKANVKDESIDDTLEDIVNYGIMTLMERRKENETG